MNVQLLSITAIRIGIAPGQPGDKSKGVKPVPPKVRDIAPGTHFVVDEATAASLVASGAAKVAAVPTAPTVVDATDSAPAPAKAKAPAAPKAPAKPKPAAAANPAATAPAADEGAGEGGSNDLV